MSFARTYMHTVLVGLDDLGAAVLFNRSDTTISSLCRLEQLGRTGPLGIRPWQHRFLRVVGAALDWIWPGHCEAARLADIARGGAMQGLLS